MHLHINASTCLSSNWDDEWYSSDYTVSIDEKLRYKHPDTSYRDMPTCSDWTKYVRDKQIISSEKAAEYHEQHLINPKLFPADQVKRWSTATTYYPTDEIVDWLNEHIADYMEHDGTIIRGWCMGNDEYRIARGYKEISFWFQREDDALAFIKHFSEYNTPTTVFNYFEDWVEELHHGELIRRDR